MKKKQFLSQDLLWYKDAIIYEIPVKAFQDSGNEGIGDLKGLISRLDYLQDLGVTALWLLPFYPSPQRDGGYDISDYYSIDPRYGTMQEFEKFLNASHKRGMRVITELVINHTSEQHPWFQRARRAPAGSPERDWYVWSDTTEKYKDARIIFQDFEASNWSWDSVAQAYYWHRFYHHQPDLNFDNPVVQEEVINVLDFWADKGVDGFRLDAVPYLFERDGTNCENLPETHVFLKKMRAHLSKKHPEVMFLAEANMWPEDSAAYFGDGDECHMNYHFPIMPRMFMSVKMEERYPIIDIIDQTPDIPDNCQWAIFLRNHDELTLEMVTDEERDYMHKAYGKDARSRINLGLRHRLAPLLDNHRGKIELMNALLFSMPGTPVLYYGDEIGMGDNVHLGDRDGVRTPMQWSPDRNAGFSKANPQQLYLPLIMDPQYHYTSINVETQEDNPSSLLWWTKRMIDMRKRFKAFGRGSIEFLAPSNPKVLAFLREYEDETLLVVANLSRFAQSAEIPISAENEKLNGRLPVEVFSQNTFPRISDESYKMMLAPYGYYWFQLQTDRVGGVDEQTEIALEVSDWKKLFEGKAKQVMEQQILPTYLAKVSWLEAGRRRLLEVQIRAKQNVLYTRQNNSYKAALLLLELTFDKGFPQFYLLPVAWSGNKGLRANTPDYVIARAQIGRRSRWLYDANYDPNFRDWMLRQAKLSIENGKDPHFFDHKVNPAILDAPDAANASHLVETDNSYAQTQYGQQTQLRLYRRLEPGVHPDEELLRFLNRETDFDAVPDYHGRIDLHIESKRRYTSGVWLPSYESQASARTFLAEAAGRYFDRVIAEHLVVATDETVARLAGEMLPKLIEQLGRQVGQLHLALASRPDLSGFEHESFSLHYQRGLYAGMQTLIRSSSNLLEAHLHEFEEADQDLILKFLDRRHILQQQLKRIHAERLDALKTRIHGFLRLGRIRYLGQGFLFDDFTGIPGQPFSEQRLRKSPLRDIATLLRSLHHVAHVYLFRQAQVRAEDVGLLNPWAEGWHALMRDHLLEGYFDVTHGAAFLPDDPADRTLLLEVFLVEEALQEITRSLPHQRYRVQLSIRSVMEVLQGALTS